MKRLAHWSSLGHYLHVSFDAMCEPIQSYADWLCALTAEPVRPATVIAPPLVTEEEDTQRLQSLSGRERETLTRLGQGQSCMDIAGHLRLSLQAVNSYRTGLLKKLHLTSTAGLIHYAVTHEAHTPVPVLAQPTPPPEIVPPIATNEEDQRRLHSLSNREYGTLAWFGQGHSPTSIATHRGISIKTVDTFRTRLLRKLHLSTTAELVRYAREHTSHIPLPLPARPVVSPIMPAPLPIAYRSQSVEREEWPG